MPGWQPRRVHCKASIAGKGATKRFLADKYGCLRRAKADCLAQFLEMFCLKLAPSEERLDIVGREIALLKRKLSGSRKPGARVRVKGGIAQDEHLWIVLCLQSWFDQNQTAFIFLQVQRVNKWVYTYTRVPNDPGDRNFFEHAVMFENHGSWCYTFHYSRGVDFHPGFVQCLLDEFPNLVAHTRNHPVAHFYYHYARLTL